MSIALSVGLCLVVGFGWAGWTCLVTAAALVAELRLRRVAERAEVRPTEVSLAGVESALIGAQDGFRTVSSRLWWEVLGLGDPALRQRELVHACGELLCAQRAMREVHRRAPYLALDPGIEVGFVEDPLRLLALRGSWIRWVGLMLLPRVVRGAYTFVVLRRAILPLLDTATELEERMGMVRQFVRPTPSVRVLAAA